MPQKVERLRWRFKGGIALAGIGRATKDVSLYPQNLNLLTTACTSGSLYAASILQDISGSVFAGVSTSMAKTYVANMGVGASPASPLTAMTYFDLPDDYDTSGSIIAYVDWTYGDAPATAGSTTRFLVGLGYLGTGSAVRTGASVGGNTNASYSGTTCGIFQTSCIGKLPSFGAGDEGAIAVLRVGASGAAESGKLSTGCIHILALRLRYVASGLGGQSPE